MTSWEDDLTERSLTVSTYGAFGPSSFAPDQSVRLCAWNSDEGRARLWRSRECGAFYRLAGFFQPQQNPIYCGVASAVVVMNALSQPHDLAMSQPELEVRVPGGSERAFFPAHSQLTFLGPVTDGIKPRRVVEYLEPDASGQYRPGLRLDELAAMIRAHGFAAEETFVSDVADENATIDAFRSVVRPRVRNPDESGVAEFIIVHFRADLIGGIPRGHVSPLAGYDAESDSVLVLDVAAHKGPWHWAPLDDLVKAMRFRYDTQPRGGGYVVVSG